MKTTIAHPINISADEFFEKIYYNEEFSDALYKKLKFKERKLLTMEDRDGEIYREVLQVPERDLPGAVKKLLGASRLEYTEQTTFKKGGLEADVKVVTSIKPDKIKVRGRFWVEPMGEGKCNRCLELEVKVGIFGIGGLVERTIIDELKKSYEFAAGYTNDWLRDHAD